MNNSNNQIFIGTRGTVLGIDQFNGKELWRSNKKTNLTNLKTKFTKY